VEAESDPELWYMHFENYTCLLELIGATLQLMCLQYSPYLLTEFCHKTGQISAAILDVSELTVFSPFLHCMYWWM